MTTGGEDTTTTGGEQAGNRQQGSTSQLPRQMPDTGGGGMGTLTYLGPIPVAALATLAFLAALVGSLYRRRR